MADATPTANAAIYHQQSPYLVLAGKIYAGVTAAMVLLAILFCFIRGATVDGTFNLLGINLIISSVIIAFLMWWYKTGALAQDKLWFLVLVASIILFQCITTDIYVFRHQTTPAKIVTPTPIPRTITPATIKPSPNASEYLKVFKAPSNTGRHKDVLFAKLPAGKRIREKNR